MKTNSIVVILFTLLFMTSCSNDEGNFNNQSKVISDSNLELLKTEASNNYSNSDFSKVINPQVNDVNYEKIVDILSQYSNSDEIINYENVLGEYYNKEYFQQMFNLYQYSNKVLESNLFNKNSSLQDREIYLEEVLNFVILENVENSKSSNCSTQYGICSRSAERSHGIRIIACTSTAVVAGIFTAGAGAAIWPICMATSGYLYDSDMTACHEYYEDCQND